MDPFVAAVADAMGVAVVAVAPAAARVVAEVLLEVVVADDIAVGTVLALVEDSLAAVSIDK
jgi:hypothetical protein